MIAVGHHILDHSLEITRGCNHHSISALKGFSANCIAAAALECTSTKGNPFSALLHMLAEPYKRLLFRLTFIQVNKRNFDATLVTMHFRALLIGDAIMHCRSHATTNTSRTSREQIECAMNML